jgi:hypothetical protein
MICDGLTTAAKVLLEVEDYIEEGVGDVPRYAGRIDRCGDRRVKCEDGCGFGGCVAAGFSLPKVCYATILRSRVCEGVMCRVCVFRWDVKPQPRHTRMNSGASAGWRSGEGMSARGEGVGEYVFAKGNLECNYSGTYNTIMRLRYIGTA